MKTGILISRYWKRKENIHINSS